MVGPRMQRENKNILAAKEESAVVDQQHQKSSLIYRYPIWSDQRQHRESACSYALDRISRALA